MGLFYAEIKLTNMEDAILAKRHIIGAEEIKSITLIMFVDRGAI
jgi:hypothetical protein